METVTVVIPTYNRLTSCRAAIESVRQQTYPNVEIIVIDDGSTDGSTEALRQEPGITLLEQANSGPAVGRDRGARHGTGELIAFLDHDDTWRPNKLDVQVPMFDDPSVAMVHCAAHLFDPRSGWETIGYVGDDVGFHDIFNYQIPGIQTSVVRRSVYEAVGGFDVTLRAAEDWDFWLRVAEKYRILGTSEVLVDLDAVPGLGGQVRRMFDGMMQVWNRARRVHPGCSECAVIAAHIERVIRMYGVETEKTRSRQLRASGKPLRAAFVRAAAYKYDPVALARLPRRALQRMRPSSPFR